SIGGVMEHITPEGHFLVPILNIAHLSIRVVIMEGGCGYENHCLLVDRHLKYFTKKKIEAMFQATGLSIQQLEATFYSLPEDRVTERLRAVGLEPTPQFWEYANSDEARAYQYIVVAGRDPGKLLQPIPLREK